MKPDDGPRFRAFMDKRHFLGAPSEIGQAVCSAADDDVPQSVMRAGETVRAQNPSPASSALRTMRAVDLKLRTGRCRLSGRVRAHVLPRILACYALEASCIRVQRKSFD